MNTEQKIEALQKQLDELRASLRNDEWPKVDDDYYILMPNGRIDGYQWENDGTDLKYKQRGIIYRTEEEAKRADDRRILIAEIREFAEHYKPVWDGETINYFIEYGVTDDTWCEGSSTYYDHLPLYGYFKDEATAQAAIEKFKDRLHLLREVKMNTIHRRFL